MGDSETEEIRDLKVRAHVIAESARQIQEDVDAILAQIKRLADDLNRVAGPRVMDDEELEESARQVRNKKFVGTKAIALRLLRELDKDNYPSLHLLLAFHKSLGEELNRIHATGYR
jgi:uncharacterized protein YwgA